MISKEIKESLEGDFVVITTKITLFFIPIYKKTITSSDSQLLTRFYKGQEEVVEKESKPKVGYV